MVMTHAARFSLALGALGALAAAGALGACDVQQHGEGSGAPPTASAPRKVERPRVPLVAPNEASVPAGREGDLVRRGRALATRTKEELGAAVGADLHCTSCHLNGGTVANAGPWVGVTSVYPTYRDRAGREITIEDRVNECLERSLNGKALAHDSDDMLAFVAYMTWLSKDVPKGSEVKGRGFARLERPPTIDPEIGKQTYAVRCASCHREDGQGKRNEEGEYQFPPLWGERSFNIGAGMARLDTAAAFVKHNMPLGQGDSLTDLDAYEITAYFTAQPRPDYAGKSRDWPKGSKPRDARY